MRGFAMNTQRKISGVSLAGLVLLILGTLFLLDNLNLIYFDPGDFLHHWWPAILILGGLNELLRTNRSGGWFLIGFGVILLLKINHVIDGHLLFALILILIGIGLLIRPRLCWWGASPTVSQSSADKIKLQAIFAGSHENVTSQNFSGGDIEVVFGKMTVDFRNIKMPPGRCRLNVETIFGHTTLLVPPEIRIETVGSPVFGQIDNQAKDVPKDENTAVIEIQTEVIFGNLEIHN